MGSRTPREERRTVFVTCRMRDDSGWSDMTICNLSSRGLMAKCNAAPPRGSFIEIRRGGLSIVGQVRWSRDNRVGIRTQEMIDVSSLLGGGPVTDAPQADRRARPREDRGAHSRPTPVVLEERSRRLSRLFDWLVIAVVGIGFAVLVATQVYSVISAPLDRTKTALTP